MTINEAIQKIAQSNDELYAVTAKVLKVDNSKRNCDVEPHNGDAIIYGVRLQAISGNDKGLIVIPVVGSDVVVVFLNKDAGIVVLSSEIERFNISIDSLTLEMTNEGLYLDGNANLKTEVNNLLDGFAKMVDILNVFQLTTNVGLTIAVAPHILTQLTGLKTDITAVKNRLNTILK